MQLPYRIIIKPAAEGGYVASIQELAGCITQAETLAEVTLLIEDAKQCWLESALDDNLEIPEPDKEQYSGKFNLRLPPSLHKELALKAKAEKVSLNQMATYLLAKGLGQ
jgi:antitoxin HicB